MTSATRSRPIHSGDKRQRSAANESQAGIELAQWFIEKGFYSSVLGSDPLHLPQITAGAKGPPGPGQDHSARALVLSFSNRLLKFTSHREREGIQRLGPVERDYCDATTRFELDGFVIHSSIVS